MVGSNRGNGQIANPRSENLYERLGVSAEATAEEIRRAYRRLALRYHPDKNPDDRTECSLRFQEVSEAYEVLSNDGKRGYYDATGLYGENAENGGGAGERGERTGGRRSGQKRGETQFRRAHTAGSVFGSSSFPSFAHSAFGNAFNESPFGPSAASPMGASFGSPFAPLFASSPMFDSGFGEGFERDPFIGLERAQRIFEAAFGSDFGSAFGSDLIADFSSNGTLFSNHLIPPVPSNHLRPIASGTGRAGESGTFFSASVSSSQTTTERAANGSQIRRTKTERIVNGVRTLEEEEVTFDRATGRVLSRSITRHDGSALPAPADPRVSPQHHTRSLPPRPVLTGTSSPTPSRQSSRLTGTRGVNGVPYASDAHGSDAYESPNNRRRVIDVDTGLEEVCAEGARGHRERATSRRHGDSTRSSARSFTSAHW